MHLIDVLGRGPAATDFAHIPCNTLAHSLAIAHFAVYTPPPRRLPDDTQLVVCGGTADSALTNEFFVLIGVEETSNDLYEHDQQSRGVSADECRNIVPRDIHDGILEDPGAQCLVGDDGQGQGDDEHEAVRGELDEADGAVEDAPVALLIMLD